MQEIADLHNLHPLVKSYLKVDMISSTRRYKKNKALADQKACTPATEANIKTCILSQHLQLFSIVFVPEFNKQ